jgi:hypothetical protein
MTSPYKQMLEKKAVVDVPAGGNTVIDLGADCERYDHELLTMVAATGVGVNVQGFHSTVAGAPLADATSPQLTCEGKYCFHPQPQASGNTASPYRYLKLFCPVATRVTVARWFRG